MQNLYVWEWQLKIAFTKKATEGLLLFGPKSFVLPFVIWESKDTNTQNHNFDYCIIQVWNLVSPIKTGNRGAGGRKIKHSILRKIPVYIVASVYAWL